MSTDSTDENVATPDPSTEVTPDETQTESSTVEGAGEQGSPSPEPTKTSAAEKSARETLIKQLTGEGDEETDSEPETAAEPAEVPAEGKGAVETPAKAEDPAPPLDAAKKTGSAEAEDETPPEGTRGKAAKRWNALIADRKAVRAERDAMKESSEYGKSLMEVAAEAQMPPAQFGAWIALGAEVHRDGPQKLPERLLAEAKRLAAHFKVQLPVERVIEKSAFDLDAFEAKLIDDITDMSIDPAIGKKYLAEIRAAKKASPQNAPAPVPAAPPAVPVQMQPSAPTPSQPQRDPVRESAVIELDRLQTEYAKQLPADWTKIRPKVVEAMARYKGSNPAHWPHFFKQEVENAKRALGARKPSIPTTTRPSTTTQTAKPKSGREEILKELAG